MTSRRGFLGAMIAAAAGAAVDPERLLWTPGAKLISIARRRNVFITPEWYSRQVLVTLQNHLTLARAVRGDYGDLLGFRPKLGDTIAVRRPLHRFRSVA